MCIQLLLATPPCNPWCKELSCRISRRLTIAARLHQRSTLMSFGECHTDVLANSNEETTWLSICICNQRFDLWSRTISNHLYQKCLIKERISCYHHGKNRKFLALDPSNPPETWFESIDPSTLNDLLLLRVPIDQADINFMFPLQLKITNHQTVRIFVRKVFIANPGKTILSHSFAMESELISSE